MLRAMVVLPEPLSPTIATVSPCATRNEAPLTARTTKSRRVPSAPRSQERRRKVDFEPLDREHRGIAVSDALRRTEPGGVRRLEAPGPGGQPAGLLGDPGWIAAHQHSRVVARRRAQDARRDQLVEIGKHFALDLDLLGHALQDEIAARHGIGQRVVVADQLGSAAVGHAQLLQHAEGDAGGARCLLELCRFRIEGAHREPAARKSRRHAGPHGAQADYRCRGHVREVLPLGKR